jgi:hypothetical protein
MHIHNLLFGIVATLFTFAHGSGYTQPAYTLMANNQSMLLGYQLYGSQIYNASAVCKDIGVASHGLWMQVETWMVQRKPLLFCFSIHYPERTTQLIFLKELSATSSVILLPTDLP